MKTKIILPILTCASITFGQTETLTIDGDLDVSGDVTLTGDLQFTDGSTPIKQDSDGNVEYQNGTVYSDFSSGNSTAWGDGETFSGEYVTAWGAAVAYYDYATAWGRAEAGSAYATAWGRAYAYGENSTAWGSGSADSLNATAWGVGDAGASFATAWGRGFVYGDYATAWGNGYANSYLTTAFGRYNIRAPFGSYDRTTWVGNDPLLEVGIGTDVNNPANALTVLKDGRMALGPHTTMADLQSNTETVQVQGSALVEEDLRVEGAIIITNPAGDIPMFGQ